MPLKIRCPHCRKILLAEDDTAGQRKLCPACGRPFDVPLPLSEDLHLTNVAGKCPRCAAEIAPGTTICQRCHTDVTTGKRLPLPQRLRRTSLKTWTVAALVFVGTGLVVYVCVNTYLARFRRPPETTRTFQPTPKTAFAAQEWATRLLQARSPDERRAAHQKLLFGGERAAREVTEAVAGALSDSLNSAAQDSLSTQNRLAALDVLASTAAQDPAALESLATLLKTCERDAALREAAWRARAMLGDVTIAANLRQIWIERVRRLVFLKRFAALVGADDRPAVDLVIQRTRNQLDRIADAFQRLKMDDETVVLDSLMPSYWDGWNWLGDQRGTALADELFELAKLGAAEPTAAQGFEAQKQSIRAARDALQRVGRRAAPLARAAAGLVLTDCAPQYRSARQRIVAGVTAVLPDCEPQVQQHLTWAVARLTGRQFGRITGDSQPTDVRHDDVQAVLRWARSSGHTDAAPPTVPPDAYVSPATLVCRVVPPARQIEHELLQELTRGWGPAATALECWLDAGLGCTERLRRQLDPGQRRPDYPTLAAAMVIVAECNDQGMRATLTLWRQATDQPAWVRQLAYSTLGALDARTGRWQSGWPAGFELPPAQLLDRGQPAWEHFGHVLAAGGEPMIKRLQTFQPEPLSPEIHAKLLDVARQIARHRARSGGQ